MDQGRDLAPTGFRSGPRPLGSRPCLDRILSFRFKGSRFPIQVEVGSHILDYRALGRVLDSRPETYRVGRNLGPKVVDSRSRSGSLC